MAASDEPSDKRVRAEAASVCLCAPDSPIASAYLAGYRQGRESIGYLLDDVRRLESGRATLQRELDEARAELKVRDVELGQARRERDELQRRYDTDQRGWIKGQHDIARGHSEMATSRSSVVAELARLRGHQFQRYWRSLKLFAYRARYLQLLHSCPNAGEGDAPRNRWNRKIRWAERRILELGGTR